MNTCPNNYMELLPYEIVVQESADLLNIYKKIA